MNDLVRLIPGLAAAAAALVAAKVIRMLPIGSLTLEILVFFVTYIVIVVMVDRAMKGYGRRND